MTVVVEHAPFPLDLRRLRKAVRNVVHGEGAPVVRVNVAVIGGAAMRKLNRQFLRHDYDTDVLTFCLPEGHAHDCAHEGPCNQALEGEIVVSADFARRMAPRYDWSPQDELLLYVIHGALHLAGYDDVRPRQRAEMRRREAQYLAEFGLPHHHGEGGAQ